MACRRMRCAPCFSIPASWAASPNPAIPTLKPAPTQDLIDFCRRHKTVVTIENHNIIGGLGSLVAEVIATNAVPTRLHRAGIEDRWGVNGDIRYIRNELGLGAEQLAERIGALQ